jgi:5-methylcytosine-specific restriction endonuclease McrA
VRQHPNLEVDHRRALMNGGDNSLDNLSTMCDACHTVKTRMDRSLNKKLGPTSVQGSP